MSHVIEPASSGRSKCRACKAAIDKGMLRLGEEVDNPFGGGTVAHWYHLRCGALRRPEPFLDAWQSFAAPSGDAPPHSLDEDEVRSMLEAAEAGKRHHRLTRFVRVHEAPSGRARCQACRELIEKGALRFVLERIEDGMVSGAGFVHLDCAHAYAGAVDGIYERVRLASDLVDDKWDAVARALEQQAKLPRVAPQESSE